VLGRVRAVVRNTYTWSIERQSSATSVAVIADGYNRQQLGEGGWASCGEQGVLTITAPLPANHD
jgi:hypothetical protein